MNRKVLTWDDIKPYANLQGANLQSKALQGANLSDANLSDANLRDANLRGTDLRSANLAGADLRGADLEGTDLRSADLVGAKVWNYDLDKLEIISEKYLDTKGAIFNGRTKFSEEPFDVTKSESSSIEDSEELDTLDRVILLAKTGVSLGIMNASSEEEILSLTEEFPTTIEAIRFSSKNIFTVETKKSLRRKQ